MKKKTVFGILALTVASCAVMAVVDGVIQPGYAVKSIIKIALFLLIPLGFAFLNKDISIKTLFKFKVKPFLFALLLGVGIYALILGAYFAVRPFYDFSVIVDSLSSTTGVTKDNFLFVSLYISFVNSLLEEFFFRGFVFVNLKKGTNRITAYVVSSAAFSLYHVAMMIGWFNIGLFLLVLAGLGAGGIIFNYLNEKHQSVYTSWFVHMFANFAINTIGFILMK